MRFPLSHRVLMILIPALVLAAMPEAARAVEPGKTSYTAEAVCAFRAIAAEDPDPMTRNPDHMAKLFATSGSLHNFPGLGLAFEDARVAMDRLDSGVFYYVNARTHHMDAMLTQALKAGMTQVVIMGAGFDSRAYRFHESFPKVRFFEIDLPATSRDKQRRVKKILGRNPDWVTYVSIDFNTQTLEAVLGKAGFSREEKTFYVWEGVTYFISETGVDSTLRFVAGHSAPGSRIVFDYMLKDVVQGTDYSPYGARRTVYFVAQRGEPYVFGIDPEQLEAFVHLRGLALLSDLGPVDLARRYLVQSNGAASGKIAEFLRIVLAEVPDTAERSRLIRNGKEAMKRQPAKKDLDATRHRIKVPADVQAFLDRYGDAMKNKDFAALSDCYSSRYLFNGRDRQMVMGWLKHTYQQRPVRHYDIILTRLRIDGDRAKIDGFVNRKSYRTPLIVEDLIREPDGRWRWFGNQQ